MPWAPGMKTMATGPGVCRLASVIACMLVDLVLYVYFLQCHPAPISLRLITTAVHVAHSGTVLVVGRVGSGRDLQSPNLHS